MRLGTRLGEWVVIKELGRGAMGAVFEARHVERGERAAVKVLSGLVDDTAMKRFVREASAGAGIGRLLGRLADKAWPLDDPPNYEPDAADSVGAIAADRGVTADEIYYDVYLRHDGRQLVLFTLGGGVQ